MSLKTSSLSHHSPTEEMHKTYASTLKKNLNPSLARDFTVSSYNIGGRLGSGNNHYDYWAAASIGKVVGERYLRESRNMGFLENVQKIALKILFSLDPKELLDANHLWLSNDCQDRLGHFIGSRNKLNQAASRAYRAIIGAYKGSNEPIIITDRDLERKVEEHLQREHSRMSLMAPPMDLHEICKSMVRTIFRNSLRQDIICIQEATWIDHEIFSLSNYSSIFTNPSDLEGPSTQVSKIGIAWNADRFEFVKTIESVTKRALAIQLRDKSNGKVISVASAHISGCNPFHPCEIKTKPRKLRALEVLGHLDSEIQAAMTLASSVLPPIASDEKVFKEVVEGEGSLGSEDAVAKVEVKKYDSMKGDQEVEDLLSKLQIEESDLLVIGLDSNVTSLHPRLEIFKRFGYQLDCINHIYSTCTNPVHVLDTRIDWILCKSSDGSSLGIQNIPIPGVELNDLTTNVSDHKPIASMISYL